MNTSVSIKEINPVRDKEKITATRIVQSYAGSKKLVNKLTINGRSEKSGADKGTAPESKPPQR